MICTCPSCSKRFEVVQPHLGLSERERSALALLRHAEQEGRVTPSIDEVAACIGTTPTAARAVLTKLESAGFLRLPAKLKAARRAA